MDRCRDLALKFVLALAFSASAADSVVQFEAQRALVQEHASNVTLRVLRTGSLEGKTEVHWSTVDGTAKAGSDYGTQFQSAGPSGVLEFLPGASVMTLVLGPNDPAPDEAGVPHIRILRSRDFEPSETFTIRLTGAGVGAQAEVSVEIAPHGRAVSFTNSRYDVAANAESAVLVVQRIGALEEGVSVEYRTRDVSSVTGRRPYTPVSGNLSWAPGDREDKTITVPLLPGTTRGPVVAVEISEALNATLLQPALALVVR